MRNALAKPVDIASLAAFRMLYGLVMAAGMVRFLASDWIDRLYVQPTFFFRYWGFEWVAVPPGWAVTALVAVSAFLALAIAAGLYTRVAAALFVLGFSYLELLDVTNYLNHYYLAALLALLLCFVPAHRAWSIDAWRNPALRADHAPRWALWLVRLQIAVVYVHAGLAKLNADWLLGAQPLSIWLAARSDAPIVGPLLDERWVAFAASWGGFLYDTTIVAWLSWRRTRAAAYLAVIGFHTATHFLFNIGMFPFIMTAAATIFFAPDWPRRWLGRPAGAPRAAEAPIPRAAVWLLGAYALFQIVVPLRHFAYPGDVAWNEEGMRFSWKVLLREKHGSVTFRVRLPNGGTVQISPGRYLTQRQEREMAGQPDLILQLAHHIAAEYRTRGIDVQVFADTRVSWNGRVPAPLIDPDRDLARVRDGLGRKDWVLPQPESPPLGRRLARRTTP